MQAAPPPEPSASGGASYPAASAEPAPDLSRFLEAARVAAQAVAARPRGSRWVLGCDTDADGLAAAAVAATALRRAGHRFHVRASRDKTEEGYRLLLAEEADGFLLLDKGTSHLGRLGRLAGGRPVVVIDHHNVPPDMEAAPGVTLLNPRACGLDGSRDASASTTAVAFALALGGDANLDTGPAGLAGAIGDWQHMGGWKGWNLELVQRCRAAGLLKPKPMPRLIGVDLADALARWGPPTLGLADARAAAAWLQGLAIDPTVEVEELDAESMTRLVSAVTLAHLAAGGDARDLEGLVREADVSAKLGVSLRHCFRIVDACGREGQPGTGIAYLLGDAQAAADARTCFQAYREALDAGLRRLREGGTVERAAVQFAWTPRHDYSGMVAGIGMTHVVPQRLPLAIFAQRPDGLVQVSTRALEPHVRRGLDLGRACRAAAEQVGAEGGGHPVAAGAVVPAGKADEFLEALDRHLVSQGFLEAA